MASASKWSSLVNVLETDWEATAHQRRTYYEVLRLRREECVTLLDAGCGIGFDVPRLTELGYEYTGVDLTPEMLTRAKERNPVANFEQADITMRIPFPDESFDIVVSHDVLIHVDDFTSALDEMWRVAKKAMVVRLAYTTALGNKRACDIDRNVLNIWRNWSYVSHNLYQLVPPPACVNLYMVKPDEMVPDSYDGQIFEVRRG